MSSSMKKATKMPVADFEAVQSIPDWAVFSFDSYMKYVGHPGASMALSGMGGMTA